MVKFDLNKELDLQILPEFLKVSGGGIDFSQAIYKYHPTLKSVNKEDFNVLAEYIENFYKSHLKELQSKTKADVAKLLIQLQHATSLENGTATATEIHKRQEEST